MFEPEVILGPPGCGKTTAILSEALEELQAGLQPDRLAVVTFTRAARQEALERAQRALCLTPQRLPWIRTIHSAAFRVLGLSPDQILDDRGWMEFARHHGYRLSGPGHRVDDDSLEAGWSQRRTPDDLLLAAYDWGRNRLLDPDRTLARFPVAGLASRAFRRFVERAERCKETNGLLDFCDLLSRAWECSERPGVDVAMVDEAHDLSPLQVRLVEKWFAPCRRVIVAGDDDQAIYVFGGAEPGWLLGLSSRTTPRILTRSHRVPVAVHGLAQRVIRSNQVRVPKTYEPRPDRGEAIELDLDSALSAIDPGESSFVLVRNRHFMRGVAAGLVNRTLPFVAEGWGAASPLSDAKLVAATRVVWALSRGSSGPFPTEAIDALLSFVPSGGGLLERGIKAEIRRRLGQGSFRRQELEDLGLGTLIERVDQGEGLSVLQQVSVPRRSFLQALIDRYGELPVPTIVLTTIHASKGREADTVLVLPDMTRSTFQEYTRGGTAGREAENRVFYVAMTRARRRLILVRPHTRRHFDFPRLQNGGGAK